MTVNDHCDSGLSWWNTAVLLYFLFIETKLFMLPQFLCCHCQTTAEVCWDYELVLSKPTGFRVCPLWSILDCELWWSFFTSEESSWVLGYLKDTASLHGMLQWFKLAAVTKLVVLSFNWERACYCLLLKFFRSENYFPALWSRIDQAFCFSPCI